MTWVAFRTRPGNVIDQASTNVAFEIDGIDPTRRRGRSVLVRGTLQHVDPDAAGFRERFDAQPWLAAERGSWLIVEPFAIIGRELHPSEPDWAFHLSAYLRHGAYRARPIRQFDGRPTILRNPSGSAPRTCPELQGRATAAGPPSRY